MTALTSLGGAAPRVALGSTGRMVLLLLLTTSCSAASCQSGHASAAQMNATLGQRSSTPDLDRYLTWDYNLVFTDAAASASTEVYLDPQGGFVVADAGQAQVRVYADSAQLVWSAGRSGPGPAEFQQLRGAVRTASGEVIALDGRGKLTVFDASGNYLRSASTDLAPAYNFWLVNDSTLLISGRQAGSTSSPLLHVWSLREQRITRSFFETPPHDSRFDQAYLFSGWANAALVGKDTVAVVFPLSDTLYLHRIDGTPLAKFKLPLENFRRIRQPGPKDPTPEARIAWRNSYTRVSQVYHAPDGAIYVQYFNLAGLDPVWGLVRVFADRGHLHKSFDVTPSHRLLGISSRDSSLFFVRADSLESTVWSVAHLSR
jgi:hypothetical protein